MELENIILSEVSQIQKAKSHMSPSCVKYRLYKNAAISHNRKGMQERGRETKKLYRVNILSIQNEYR
jgi:hypothetical protein